MKKQEFELNFEPILNGKLDFIARTNFMGTVLDFAKIEQEEDGFKVELIGNYFQIEPVHRFELLTDSHNFITELFEALKLSVKNIVEIEKLEAKTLKAINAAKHRAKKINNKVYVLSDIIGNISKATYEEIKEQGLQELMDAGFMQIAYIATPIHSHKIELNG